MTDNRGAAAPPDAATLDAIEDDFAAFTVRLEGSDVTRARDVRIKAAGPRLLAALRTVRAERDAIVQEGSRVAVQLSRREQEATDALTVARARLAALEAAVKELVPRWREVDQGGEIFGWKVPDRGRSIVVAAPRTIEAFLEKRLAALLAPSGETRTP